MRFAAAMKKKLAIFTLAIGFFTVGNIVLYTRKLRADEMTTFWHWSAAARNGPNCSLYLMDDQNLCSNGANGNTLPEGTASTMAENQLPPTLKSQLLSTFQNGSANQSQSSILLTSTQQPFFVLKNQTHYLSSVGGSEVSTLVTLRTLNRTIRVTFNMSLFINHGISIRTGNASRDFDKSTTLPSLLENATKGPVTNPSNGLTVLNEHPFSYLINVQDLCGGQPLTLVILVTTAVNHFAHRKAIRETWGGLAKRLPNVQLVFAMGRPTDPEVQTFLMQEALQFADIIQEDFLDTYKNLTLKTVMLLRWVHTYCPAARFVMKSDDDVFINLSNLLYYIRTLRQDKKLMFGRLVKGARPLRSKSSKYFVPVTEYKDKVYPDYLSGTAYVMSGDVAPKLIHIAQITPIFFFEDVFITGICAKKAGIARRNHAGFVYFKRQVKGCAYYRVISGHNNTPNDMRKIWKDLQNKNIKC